MAISDLQLALIGLGAAAVGAVWGYNKLQERSHRRAAERILAGDHPDALLGGTAVAGGADGRIEPAAGPGDERGDVPVAALPEAAIEAAATVDVVDSPWADPVADAVARVTFVEAIPAPTLWAAQAEWAERLDKPLHWVGFAGGWQLIDAHDAGSYAAVAAALQLADRRGAVTDSDIANFADGVRRLADQLAGVAMVPDGGEALACAQALDEFCAEVDFQLAVNVVASGDGIFAGERLRELAEAAALRLGDDGVFHARDEHGHTLYTLGNLGVELFDADTLASLGTQGVTLSLDVPNVAQGPEVFDRMVAAGAQLAQDLGGTLVDGQRAPLTAAMIEAIRSRIAEIQSRMAARQIPAGSERARRLFS
jgi:hypothetical protein